MTAHWGIEDPAAVTGTEFQQEAAFVAAFRYMRSRISAFTTLPLASIDKMSLRATLKDIGEGEGASTSRPQVA